MPIADARIARSRRSIGLSQQELVSKEHACPSRRFAGKSADRVRRKALFVPNVSGWLQNCRRVPVVMTAVKECKDLPPVR
jgi:hypothetical protein